MALSNNDINKNVFWSLHADGEPASDGSDCTERCLALGCLIGRGTGGRVAMPQPTNADEAKAGDSGEVTVQERSEVATLEAHHDILNRTSVVRRLLDPKVAEFRPRPTAYATFPNRAVDNATFAPVSTALEHRIVNWILAQPISYEDPNSAQSETAPSTAILPSASRTSSKRATLTMTGESEQNPKSTVTILKKGQRMSEMVNERRVL